MTDKRKKHPRADLYMADRAKGLTYTEIGAKYGVSYQAVAQVCGKIAPSHFKPYTAEEVVYPNLRRWLNENKIARSEFARRLGNIPSSNYTGYISEWFRGRKYPIKTTIDKIIAVTGLSYEKLFEEEGDDG